MSRPELHVEFTSAYVETGPDTADLLTTAGVAGRDGDAANRFTGTLGGFDLSVTAGAVMGVAVGGAVVAATASTAVGIATAFALLGQPVTVQTGGVVEVAGWGLTPGGVYYLAGGVSGGQLTTSPTGFNGPNRRIGAAVTATTLALDIGPYVAPGGGLTLGATGGLIVPRGLGALIPAPTGVYPLGSSLFRPLLLTTFRVKLTAGTLTVSVLRNGTPVPGWDALATTTAEADHTPTGGAVACAAGDVLALSFSAVAGTGFTFGLSE